MKYRKDIQILRGIAVLLVVLFHLQIGGIESGFLGVDIFFVISGFLMAILYKHDEKSKFFKRRAKRLLPTYYTIILLTLLVSVIYTIPNEYNQVAEQSIYATVFSSNIGFWMQNSYFSKADFNPLLHLWSLGVEIQFYLIVPILYWFFKKSKLFLPLILLLSLLVCFYFVGISAKTSFFMMPTRLWEFLLGYGVALYFTNNGNIRNSSFSWVGLIAMVFLIAIPFFEIDGKSLEIVHGHPGLFALLVSLMTAVILLAGIPAIVEKSKIGTSFAILGKYSYSIYLVHFPIIVLFLYSPFSGTILKTDSYLQTISLIVIIAISSILMYRLVESPTRHSKKFGRYILIMVSLIMIIILLGTKIQSLKYSDEENKIFNASKDRGVFRCGKLIRVMNPSAISCNLTTEINKPTKNIFLIGNSHADSIKSAFVSVAKQFNVGVSFSITNKTMIRGGISPERIIKESLAHKIDTIVLHYSPHSIKIDTIKKLTKLATKNNIEVSFIMPVPVWKNHIPKVMYNHLEHNETLPSQTQDDYKKANEKFYKELQEVENILVYRVDDILCQPYCKFENLGIPYYFDTGHLTLTGSASLSQVFKAVVEDTMATPSSKEKLATIN